MTNIAVQSVTEGAYETAPYNEPNRYISADVNRGSRIILAGGRDVLNTASGLASTDIDELRDNWKHTIIEDPGEQVIGAVTEAELKRKADYLAGVVAEAQRKGDMRAYWENEESARIAAGALRDFLARQTAVA